MDTPHLICVIYYLFLFMMIPTTLFVFTRKRCCHFSDPVLSVRPGSKCPNTRRDFYQCFMQFYIILIHKFVVSRSFKIRFCLDISDYRPFGLLTLRTNELTRVISVVWDNCSQTDNDRLEKLQLEAARIVTVFSSRDSLYLETGWEK
jgi:hypothetical protein